MAEDHRYLQYLCRRQAALASQPAVREALLEMAEEYRISADFAEQMNAPKPRELSILRNRSLIVQRYRWKEVG
jgi:hypothetical protein